MDYEILPGEEDKAVPVSAICRGGIVFSGHAEGYGGLVIQRCRIAKQDVTVLYGHLALDGLPAEGVRLQTGQQIGILAPARSYENGWNRKHLHLGIHRGRKTDLRGYVQREEELDQYIDPLTVLP